MSRILEIAKMPTVNDNVHESIFRSYHVLSKVVELLEKRVPHEVILDLIDEMQPRPEETGETVVPLSHWNKSR